MPALRKSLESKKAATALTFVGTWMSALPKTYHDNVPYAALAEEARQAISGPSDATADRAQMHLSLVTVKILHAISCSKRNRGRLVDE